MRVGYLGPEGTFSDEALHADPRAASGELEPVPCATIRDAVIGVQDGTLDEAVVPLENSLQGTIAVTLDTLALDTPAVRIAGESLLAVHHYLVAARPLQLARIERVASHPQPLGQCARFLRERLAGAEVATASSTAEAVRAVAGSEQPWAAIGTRRAAEIYGAQVLAERIEDVPGNVTRFAWLAREADGAREAAEAAGGGEWKTSLVFWGPGDDTPGWLVRCLSEFAFRGVNLTMIESRPRRTELGHYMFFADVEGNERAAPLDGALHALRSRAEKVRVLGSYRPARSGGLDG